MSRARPPTYDQAPLRPVDDPFDLRPSISRGEIVSLVLAAVALAAFVFACGVLAARAALGL